MKCPITHQNCLNSCKWSLKNGTCAVPLIGMSLNSIAESLESIASEAKRGNNALEQQALSVAEIAEKRERDEPTQIDSSEDKKEAPQPKRLANENDINVWLDGMSVEAVMSQPTAAIYERFERWCNQSGITPVGRRSITERVKKRFDFAVGYLDTAKNEPIYIMTPKTHSHIKRGKNAPR